MSFLREDALRGVQPSELRRYLAGMGWRLVEASEDITIGTLGEESMAIPAKQSLSDYPRRVLDAIRVAAEIAEVSLQQVYRDLISPPSDRITFSLKSPDGLLSLEHDAAMHAGIRDCCKAAAAIQIRPKRYHGAVRGAIIDRLDANWKVSPSRFGSYEVDVVCPLNSLEPEPFEPRAQQVPIDFGIPDFNQSRSRRVLESMEAALLLLHEGQSDEALEALAQTPDERISVSFNFCESLLELEPETYAFPLHISFQWSPAFEKRCHREIVLAPADIRFIERLAQRLAPTPVVQQPREFQGWVKALHKKEAEIQEWGDIVLAYEDEKCVARKLRATLGPSDFRRAIQAFQEQRRLSVTGILHYRPRVRILSDVSRVDMLIDDNDASIELED